MTLKKRIQFAIIKIQRYIFRKKFISIFEGPLKGYKWSTSDNYEYLTGDYEEKKTMDTFFSWLKPDSVFYDLGANVGYYSFLASLRISKGKIYSFEPMPANINTFNTHLRLNNNKIKINNIDLLPYAISDKAKDVSFSNNGKTIEGNTYIDSALQSGSSKNLIVRCFSVDELIEQGYQKPDVIKIDVEGAEYDVLIGAKKTLMKFKPNILLATHDCHLPGIQKQCVDFLNELGYELELLKNDKKIISGLDDYIAVYKENSRI